MDLNDTTKTTIYIPHNPSGSSGGDYAHGSESCIDAYREAWNQTRARIQEVIKSLHQPVVESVVQEVHNAYKDILPGLPYPDIPVMSVSAPSAGPSFMNAVITRLKQDDCVIAHVHPSDCANVMNAMRTIISGFVQQDSDVVPSLTRKATSLAPYDIGLLVAWCEAHTSRKCPEMVVLLHDFEAFDVRVMQNIWEIFSLHIPTVPIVFLLSLSAPPSYIRRAYPRSTMTLLRIRSFQLPSGEMALEQILERTYFDPMYTPPIVIGPPVLEFLGDYFSRWNGFLDGLITVLQLVHMQHFTDPLTVLCSPSPKLTVQSYTPEDFPVIDALFTRLCAPKITGSVPPDHEERWNDTTVDSLLEDVERARTKFWQRARRLRIGWQVGRVVARILDDSTPGGAKKEAETEGLVEMMSTYMRGRGGRGFLGKIGKLDAQKLRQVLQELVKLLEPFDEQDALDDLQEFLERIEAIDGTNDKEQEREIALDLTEWLSSFISARLANLEDCTLWDLWYTGGRAVPSELLNPNIRASIISGLLKPHAYLKFEPNAPDDPEAQGEEPDLHLLPDISILFRRYLDSGKLINVWDWYQSFVAVCDTQREERKKKLDLARNQTSSPKLKSPKKRGRRDSSPTKGKGKGKEVDQGAASQDEEPDEETWSQETHARFIRALHELDYLGFIRHTARKKDCVMRTVWEGEWDE